MLTSFGLSFCVVVLYIQYIPIVFPCCAANHGCQPPRFPDVLVTRHGFGPQTPSPPPLLTLFQTLQGYRLRNQLADAACQASPNFVKLRLDLNKWPRVIHT